MSQKPSYMPYKENEKVKPRIEVCNSFISHYLKKLRKKTAREYNNKTMQSLVKRTAKL